MQEEQYENVIHNSICIGDKHIMDYRILHTSARQDPELSIRFWTLRDDLISCQFHTREAKIVPILYPVRRSL